jgi:hypothetical protein
MSGNGKNPVYAFVLGAARSGTTAMVELLNTHPAICMGVERYKRYYRRHRSYPASLLTRERFFTFEQSDTNARPDRKPWKPLYETLAAKWDSARVVGDKEGFAALPHIIEGIPEPRIIFMLRDIAQVASSWNARAANVADKWPERNDFRAAVRRWNEANALAASYADRLGPRLLVLEYERFFSGDDFYADRVMGFLTLEPGNPDFMRAYHESVRHFREVVSRKSPLVFEGQAEFLEREADMETYERLSTIARSS